MIKAVIFDMDDLLVKSEQVVCDAYREVLGKHGVELSENGFYSHWVTNGMGITDFIKINKLDLNPVKLRTEMFNLYKERTKNGIALFDGTDSAVSNLSKVYKIAIASSSRRYQLDWNLKISGLGEYFEATVSKCDVNAKKPDPECFVLAAKLLGVEPKECVAVDDSWKGIKAGKDAGMKTVWIPTEITKNDVCEPDVKLKSIKELTPELIESL